MRTQKPVPYHVKCDIEYCLTNSFSVFVFKDKWLSFVVEKRSGNFSISRVIVGILTWCGRKKKLVFVAPVAM